MKKILCGAVAAIALVGVATPAAAQTNERHYAGLPIVGTATHPGPVGAFLADLSVAGGIGTRYTAQADAPSNTGTIGDISVAFNLSGEVEQDCSFYSGNNASARDIDFGVFGIRGGDNENVGSAFEMVGPAVANIETLTAGCNFNNEVSLTKFNGTSGLLNGAAGGYDTNQFQANIPYSVNASWTGVAVNTTNPGTPQSLAVSTSQAGGTKLQGAWRSEMDINITAPAITSKGLVAGNYSDVLPLKLTAQ